MMLRTMRAGFLFAGLAVLLVSGCSRKIREYKPGVVYKPTETVARVDGQKMNWDQLDKRARNYLKDEVDSKSLFVPPGGEEKALEFFRRKALTLFVNKTVLLEDAQKRGVTVSPTERQKFVAEMEGVLKERNIAASLDDFFKKSPLGEKETRREFEDGLLVDKLIQDAVRSKITVSESDREALANEIIAKRRDAKNKADDLRMQLTKGADFAAVAKDASKGEDKRVLGGDLGEITRGRTGNKQLEDAIFSLKINEISQVLDIGNGFSIFRVAAHTPAKAAAGAIPATPESVHASFINVRTAPMLKGKDMDKVLQERKMARALTDFLKALRAKAKIEIIYKDLAF